MCELPSIFLMLGGLLIISRKPLKSSIKIVLLSFTITIIRARNARIHAHRRAMIQAKKNFSSIQSV